MNGKPFRVDRKMGLLDRLAIGRKSPGPPEGKKCKAYMSASILGFEVFLAVDFGVRIGRGWRDC